MPVQVLMPQLGESVHEGVITKWLKAPGEPVDEFEPLLEVNTDKVDTEVPSPAAGVVLELLVPEGATVQTGQLLAWIGEAGESSPGQRPTPASTPAQELSDIQLSPAPQVQGLAGAALAAMPLGRERDLGFISPVVAKIASENQVDLFDVPGTGQGGRITKRDILAYLERRQAEPAAPARTAPPVVAPAPERAAPPPEGAALAPPTPAVLPGEALPHTMLRRSIAEHMLNSKRTAPHVTTVMEVDMSRVSAHREAHKAAFARDGIKLTYTPYFISAAVSALKAYPMVNSSWSEEALILHRQINIGMATSLGEAGLIVPVIKNADALSLLGLAQAVNDLANRARARQLKPDEVQGGTFTITNHGTSGSLFATPIINQPQCAILGVGIIQKRVVVVSDEKLGDLIAIRPMVYLSLSFDHRILDGASADNFLWKIVATLQNWD